SGSASRQSSKANRLLPLPAVPVTSHQEKFGAESRNSLSRDRSVSRPISCVAREENASQALAGSVDGIIRIGWAVSCGRRESSHRRRQVATCAAELIRSATSFLRHSHTT